MYFQYIMVQETYSKIEIVSNILILQDYNSFHTI